MTNLTHSGLPASIHTEVTILGAMLLDAEARTDAIAKLSAWDFSLDSHQRIYKAIVHLHTQGGGIDTTTVIAELDKRREVEAIGGIAYLFHLTEDVPRNINIDSYIAIVKEKATLRDLHAMYAEGQSDAADPAQDAQSLIERTQARIRELLDEQTTDIQHVGQYLSGEPEAMFETLATVSGIKFGFAELDDMIGGAQPGDLIIIAARPSMGKTALACCVNWNIAAAGKISALFSLEQKRGSIVRRMLSSASRIDYRKIRENDLRSWDKQLLLEQREVLASLPLYIDDTPSQTASRIRGKCERLQRRVGLNIAFIDQLSHVSMSDCREKDFRLKVGEQTKMFKRMALEMNIPVVVFNQLKRGDDEPKLSDLKESGNIEEDADVVIFPHRPEYYDRDNSDLHGLGQFIVAKNREGATGTAECTFQGKILRWEDR